MNCTNCGNMIPDGQNVCGICGMQMISYPNMQYQQPQQSMQPMQPVNTNMAQPAANGQLGMGWFKFMVNFALFFSAFIAVVNAIGVMSGSVYGGDADLVFALFGGLKTVGVIFGILYLAVAAGSIYARFQLAGFKKNGPKTYYILVIASNLVYIFYVIAVVSTVKNSAIGAHLAASDIVNMPTLVTQIIVGFAMLAINYTYLTNRKHMFVN